MPGFGSVGQYAGAQDAGRMHFCSLRKVPGQASTAGWWVDLSMASGNPKPQYYASSPLVASVFDGTEGIFHGFDKSPDSKHLTEIGLMTPTAAFVGQFILMDYLLYYAFVDGDELADQVMTNSTPLPRYSTGEGVMVMAVSVAPTVGGGSFTFIYVNQDGVTKTSPVQVCSTISANIASLATTQPALAGAPPGPFLTLANGDTGVRSIVSATFIVANGGLLSLVLVKTIADTVVREINTAKETSYVNARPGAPRIFDGAYLNMIMNCAGSVAAGTLAGHARFVWSS